MAGLSKGLFLSVALVGVGCQPFSRALLEDVDLRPPTLVTTAAVSERAVSLVFTEWVIPEIKSVVFDPPLAITSVSSGATVEIITAAQQIGLHYRIAANVADGAGNTTWFVASFWGFNANVPQMLINEVATQGSATRPDAVELYVVGGGNLGGVTLLDGVPGDFRDRVVLAAIEVSAGDYVIIHATANGLGEDERLNPDESTHALAIAGAWDSWLENGGGLSGNNGVLTLLSNPAGDLLDAMVYSNRTSTSDEAYRGFGSRTTMERADFVAERRAWVHVRERIAPEDAVSSAATTSTRTMGRSSASVDTNAGADWHTVPTRGASFGSANSDERHQQSQSLSRRTP
jgi:hypothetical protein